MATTLAPQTTGKLVGKRVRRREDPRLITGTATYVDDIQSRDAPRLHCAQPLRGRKVKGIDTKAALNLPGVAAVFTGKDVRESARYRAERRFPGCVCRIITSWLRTVSISLDTQWQWWWRPIVHRTRRSGCDRSGLRRGRLSATPKRLWSPAHRPSIRSGRTTSRSRITRREAI